MSLTVPDILTAMAKAAQNIDGVSVGVYPPQQFIDQSQIPALVFMWDNEGDTRIEPSGMTGSMWLPTLKAQLIATSWSGDVPQDVSTGDNLVTPIVDFYNRPLREWSEALVGKVHRVECVRVRPAGVIRYAGHDYYGAEFFFEAKLHRRKP